MHRRPALRLIAPFLAAALFASVAAAKVVEQTNEVYPFNPNGTISLSNVNGSVEIVAWDRNEISLEAEKSARDAEALKHIAIEIEHAPDRLVIKTEHKKVWKLWQHSNAQVAYRLKVPAGVALKKIDVVNSSIRVSGVRGYVDLDSVNGSIKADGLAAGGRFDTVNGSITASFVALGANDKVVLDTVNGSCTVVLPKDAAFSLKADSVNGRITCDFPIKLTKSGRGVLVGSVNGGGASLVLDSVNGGLRVKIAE